MEAHAGIDIVEHAVAQRLPDEAELVERARHGDPAAVSRRK
jgi:hypothetical protein